MLLNLSAQPLIVSLASPLAVIVVGKNIVVPLGLRLGEREGETMKGDMLPILVISSRKELPFVNGEPMRVAALVGRP